MTRDTPGTDLPPIRILLVEDEMVAAMDLKQNLIRLGYEVPALATSGEEAVRQAREVRPDLILMDITLYGPMSGIDAAEEIRKEQAIPIVYLTAHADADTIAKAKLTVPYGYLPKPFSMAAMRATIEMAFHKHRRDGEARRLERQSFADELSVNAAKLHDANIALKVLLEQREQERRDLEHSIQTNVSKLILPALCALENSKLSESQRMQVELIKLNLQLLTETYISQSGRAISQLSATEMQVANFVKAGKSTKEIAQFLGVACSTINTHRDSIRKKMGIKNAKTTLKKTLQSTL